MVAPFISEFERLEAALLEGKAKESELKRYKYLFKIVDAYRKYSSIVNDYNEAMQLGGEWILEAQNLKSRATSLEKEIRQLTSSDANLESNAIIEIRAGAGGEEASLFSADLFRAYTKYANSKGFDVRVLSLSKSDRKGFKEIVFLVSGLGAYETFKFEGGVHRVQRVPVTEASGRIHTSTVTVAVMPESNEFEVKIDPLELKIETFRASGHGGQHLQKTESAVRITHIPTGIVVSCQEERSQIKNREIAMRILYSKLRHYYETKRKEEENTLRRSQIKSAERSEKIRTYNYPQNRVTDHRYNITVNQLKEIMEGDFDILLEKIKLKAGAL